MRTISLSMTKTILLNGTRPRFTEYDSLKDAIDAARRAEKSGTTIVEPEFLVQRVRAEDDTLHLQSEDGRAIKITALDRGVDLEIFNDTEPLIEKDAYENWHLKDVHADGSISDGYAIDRNADIAAWRGRSIPRFFANAALLYCYCHERAAIMFSVDERHDNGKLLLSWGHAC